MPAPDSSGAPFRRVGVVGLGLIGGSIALALRRRSPETRIVGVDRRPVLDAARAGGAIDEESEALAGLTGADLVVLAAPIPVILESVVALAGIAPGAVVTDVGSTKRRVVAAAADAGLAEFVGGHPMAGRERGGFESARADLFERRPWFLTPGRATPASRVRVQAFVRLMGAEPIEIDPERHDRTMAYVSHLPQIASTALMEEVGAAVGLNGLACAGRGLDDMTRLASSPADVWTGILATNADFIAEAASRLAESIGRFGRELEDAGAVDARFRKANEMRDVVRAVRKA